MTLRTVGQIRNLYHQRVLLRLDLNVPLTASGAVDPTGSFRLEKALPTLRHLLRRKAKVIILAHLGRPQGRIVERLRLDPVGKALSKLLGQEIIKLDDAFGKTTKLALEKLKGGQAAILENLRFYPGEEENDLRFVRELAKYGDYFVNDAFAVCHRSSASVVGLAKVLPAYAGKWLEREVKELSKVLRRPAHPAVAIFGGVKISDKIKMIENLLPKFDSVVLGGGLASTLFLAKGFRTGKSLVEKTQTGTAKQLLKSKKVILPEDVLVSRSFQKPVGLDCRLPNDVRPREVIVDIGPDMIELVKELIRKAKLVLWNGPVGYSEVPAFAVGTDALIRSIGRSSAYAVAGGGETLAAVKRLKAENNFGFLSTGGGAMLEFLEGKELPGLKVLKR